MKRFSGLQTLGLVFAVIFFIAGVTLVMWPRASISEDANHPAMGNSAGFVGMTDSRSRLLGMRAIAVGVGLGLFAIIRPKRGL